MAHSSETIAGAMGAEGEALGAEALAHHEGGAPTGAPGKSRVVFGMPIALLWGYIAIAIFMTGDGIEIAFLSKYLVGIGYSTRQAAELFSAYGLTAALSSWFSGALADVYRPKRIMMIGTAWWIFFHIFFLVFGVQGHNFTLMLVFYAARGIAYPLFYYAFFYWIVQKTPEHRLASALGWVWSMFVLGYGTISSFLPSFTIPLIGFLPTLWMSIAWVLIGGLIAGFALKSEPSDHSSQSASLKEQIAEIARSVTLIFENRDIAIALITRVICNLSFFGIPVIMPIFYTSPEIGFTMPQWLRIYSFLFGVQLFSNIAWGMIGDRIGWLRQMRWFGFVGCGIATLLFYYLPLWAPGNMAVGILASVLFALTVTAFVPMGAIFPMIAPEHKGAAVSVQNLGGGLSNFAGPAIAGLVVESYGVRGVVICYAVLYFIAAVLTCFIRLKQPKGKMAPVLH